MNQQIEHNRNCEPEEIRRIYNLYAAVLHDAACCALTRVCDKDTMRNVPKGLRYCVVNYSRIRHHQESYNNVMFARLWFQEHPDYEAELRAERKITFKEVCYILDLPYKEVKSLILQLLSNIDNNNYIINNINIYNNIYINNIYNNIPCGDK